MNYKALIIAILLGGIGIVAASVAVGIAVRDQEVEENAYEAGLHYDAALKREAALGWRVELPRNVRSGEVVIPVDVLDRNGAAIPDATVDLELSRAGGHAPRIYRCSGIGNGRYAADVKLEESGCWEATVHVARKGDTIRFNEKIYAQ